MISKFQTTLDKINRLTSDVLLFRFKLNNPEKLIFKAGQYMILTITQPNGQLIKRLYSIASEENNNTGFDLLVKIVFGGTASTYLNQLKEDDQVEFEGPAGLFTLRESNKGKIFLVTGTGIAPILSMVKSNIKKFHEKNIKIILFWGLSNMKEAYLLDNLRMITDQYHNFSFHLCLSKEKDFTPIDYINCFYQERVTGGWLEYVKRENDGVVTNEFVNKFDYYLCSGREILDSLRQHLYDSGVNKENVFFEKF